jgi:hypothetical protein
VGLNSLKSLNLTNVYPNNNNNNNNNKNKNKNKNKNNKVKSKPLELRSRVKSLCIIKENCPCEKLSLPSPAKKYCPREERIFEGGKEISQGNLFFQLREIHFSDPYPQVSCPRKLGHKIFRVRVRKVDFPGWKKASLPFQFLYGRK